MNVITDAEFTQFQQFIFDAAGITISSAKKMMVCGRLSKRLLALGMETYTQYLELLGSGNARDEVQTAIDLLTTNETYFFRESKHFDLLGRLARNAAQHSQPLRVWSAACSTGEECYSMAMTLADQMGDAGWEILGTDISATVLGRARIGHYSLSRTQYIPQDYLKRFCLKGHGEQEGTLLVDRELRRRVNFAQVNLNATLPRLGSFDAIFLRNVLIYFSRETKRDVVARVLSHLKPGGYFCIGHSESLQDVNATLNPIAPAIFQKPASRP
ncbi:chemotaxis protein methyltransferase [Burkholderia multivorans]